MPREPSLRWYARPVLFVSDIDRSVSFYVDQLGFKERWRHEDAGKPLVAQVPQWTPHIRPVVDGSDPASVWHSAWQSARAQRA